LANSVHDAYDYLSREGQDCVVLYPGDSYTVGTAHDSSAALKRFDELPSWDRLPYDPIEMKSLDEIFDAYHGLAKQIRDRYSPGLCWRCCGRLRSRYPTLRKVSRFRC